MSADSEIAVEIEKGTMTLPSNINTPVILVGPGTGVAPMRSFLQERIASGGTGMFILANMAPNIHQMIIDNMLYFGCRSLASDYHYKDEWDSYVRDGQLILRAAGSRDQVRES